jgi:hypothetical protein
MISLCLRTDEGRDKQQSTASKSAYRITRTLAIMQLLAEEHSRQVRILDQRIEHFQIAVEHGLQFR